MARPVYTLIALLTLGACSSKVARDELCASARGTAAERAQLAAPMDAAVAIFFESPDSDHAGLCSGLVLSSRWVLTARHCIAGRDDYAFSAKFGPDVRDGARSIPVTTRIAHPSRDIALLELASDAGVTPLRWAHAVDPLPPLVGVGFGGADGATRLCARTPTTITTRRVDTLTFQAESDPPICHGDSGASVLGTIDGEAVTFGLISAAVMGQPGEAPGATCSRIGVVEGLDRDDPFLRDHVGESFVQVDVQCEPGTIEFATKVCRWTKAP